MECPLAAKQCCGLFPMLELCKPHVDGRIRPHCSAKAITKRSGWERGHSTVTARIMGIPVGEHEIGTSLEESCG